MHYQRHSRLIHLLFLFSLFRHPNYIDNRAAPFSLESDFYEHQSGDILREAQQQRTLKSYMHLTYPAGEKILWSTTF